MAAAEDHSSGTFLGVLTMSLLDNGADLLQLSYYWISIVQGVIILAALVIKTQGVQKRQKQTESLHSDRVK